MSRKQTGKPGQKKPAKKTAAKAPARAIAAGKKPVVAAAKRPASASAAKPAAKVPPKGPATSAKPVAAKGGIQGRAAIKAVPEAGKKAAPAPDKKVKIAAKSTAQSKDLVKKETLAALTGKAPASGSGPKTTVPPSPARTVAVAKTDATKKTEGGTTKMAPRAKVSEIVLPAGYRPSEDEPFMNEMHRAYFRKRLLEWKDEILRQTRETLAILHEDSTQHADLADRATSETDRATELRTRDRQRKLIAKIDAAVARIEDGSYGYCEETGEPIGLKRLDARPIATLSVEAQERHERREKVYREE